MFGESVINEAAADGVGEPLRLQLRYYNYMRVE
jgi:hypothetical protein